MSIVMPDPGGSGGTVTDPPGGNEHGGMGGGINSGGSPWGTPEPDEANLLYSKVTRLGSETSPSKQITQTSKSFISSLIKSPEFKPTIKTPSAPKSEKAPEFTTTSPEKQKRTQLNKHIKEQREVKSVEYTEESLMKELLSDSSIPFDFETRALSRRVNMETAMSFILPNSIGIKFDRMNPLERAILEGSGIRTINIEPLQVQQEGYHQEILDAITTAVNTRMLLL